MQTKKNFVSKEGSSTNVNFINSRKKNLLELWELFLKNQQLPQFDKWIAAEFKKNSKYGSKDRKFYAESLFSLMRHAPLAYVCQNIVEGKAWGSSAKMLEITNASLESLKSLTTQTTMSWFAKLDPNLLLFFSLVRYLEDNSQADILTLVQLYQAQETSLLEIFTCIKNLCLQSLSSSSKNPELAMVWYGFPPWASKFLLERATQDNWNESTLLNFLSKLNVRPPLWLRLNFPMHSETVISQLESEGFALSSHPTYSALEAIGAKGIYTSSAYRDGKIEIQDLASQQIGAAILVQPGQAVWDCCAGGGGKTLQIASVMQNKGVIYASDIRQYKLEEVKKRAKRAGFFNIRCLPWDGETKAIFPREIALREGFDWVLVDSPCTSSGTWRRNPDVKYRFDSESFILLSQTQLKILKNASLSVKKGGFLVFSTCSFFVWENEGCVHQFLEQNQSFELVSQKILGCPFEDADSMFVAVIQKRN